MPQEQLKALEEGHSFSFRELSGAEASGILLCHFEWLYRQFRLISRPVEPVEPLRMAIKALVALLVPAAARLGEPNVSNASILCRPSPEELLPGGRARGAEYWEQCQNGTRNGTERSGYYHNPSLRKLEDIMRPR